MTTNIVRQSDIKKISTHTLTWSVTRCPSETVGNVNFNSHAHVERDIGKMLDNQLTVDFNSHAHVERDWTKSWVISRKGISTHTLTWSVTG